RPRHHRAPRAHRQRLLLPPPRLAPLPCRRRPHPQAHPALHAPHERQGRALYPHDARRVGLRPPLPQRGRPPPRVRPLAAHLQSPPAPQRTTRTPTSQPCHQPAWAVHLGLDYESLRTNDDPIDLTRRIVEAACGPLPDGTIEDEERRVVAAQVAEWVLEANA